MTTHACHDSEAVGRSYSGKTAQQRDVERHARLREAGLDLAGSRGLATITVEEICARAKVSTRHFYQLYDTKDALFGELYELATYQSLARSQAAYDETRALPFPERVRRAYLACVIPMIEDARVSSMIFGPTFLNTSPVLDRKRFEFHDALTASLCHEAAAGTQLNEAALTRLRYVGLAITGAIDAIVYDWIVIPRYQTTIELEKTLGSIVALLVTHEPAHDRLPPGP